MRITKKSVAIALSVFTLLGSVFAQSTVVVKKPTGDEYWYILKQAQDYYDYNDYGKAVSFAEQAKNKRKALVDWEQYTLDQAQRVYSVRVAGDDLGLVLEAMKKNKLSNALSIVQSYTGKYGSEKFNGKFSSLISFIKRNSAYPEADYLIGKVYKLEGESRKAETYMKKAYENFDLLSISDVKYDILYDMADIAKSQLNSMNYGQYLRNNKITGYYADYEKYMTDILADDRYYSDNGLMNAMVKVVAAKDKKAMTRFFELYRCNNDRSLDALIGLASYYRTSAAAFSNDAEVKAELTKSLRCAALGSIIALTRIEDTLKDRLTDFSYTTIKDLFYKASKYGDIVNWGNDYGVWELFCVLSQTASDLGYTSFSDELIQVISLSNPEPYWREWAMRQAK